MIGQSISRAEEFYERQLIFGQQCLALVKKLPLTNYNKIYSDQLIRSASSPGANYIEALEAMSKKDFIHRLKVCRKEIRESVHWLRMIDAANNSVEPIASEVAELSNEGRQLIRIFTASIKTAESNQSRK